MRSNFSVKIFALASAALLGIPLQAVGQKEAAQETVAVSLENDNYRVSNYVVACYSIGKAAVHGEKGIIQTSMLVRYEPFREWIAVYYDPKLTSEEKIAGFLRERRCPSAKLDRKEATPLTVMNRIVGGGDAVQIRIAAGENPGITKVDLPPGWKLIGEPSGFQDPDGTTFFTIRIPAREKYATHTILLHPKEGDALKAEVEVVQKAG